MGNPRPLPPVDPLLVEWLEAKYPNRVPSIDAEAREVWAAVGEQRVIDYLKAIILRTAKDNLVA